MANKPNIRFKGFTEEWKNSAFGTEVTSMSYKKYVKSPEPLGMYPIIQQGDNPICGYANGEPILDYEDKIIFGDHTTSVYKPITPFFAATDGIRIFSIKGLPPFFTYSLFERYKPKSIGYARHTLLLLETRISIPVEQKEAENIGDYFKKLNSTITQREKELEKLKNIKRALLEKLFPQNGEKVPALRFKEFTEEWGEVALGSIADRVTTKNSSKAYTETFTNSAEHGIMSQSDFFDHAIANQENIAGYYVVQENDFVYNPRISKLAPVGPINRNKLGRTGVVSPLYTVFRPKNVSVEYLEVFFMQNSWNKFMNFNGNSGARLDRFSISDAIFWQMPIQYPQFEEQRKIAKLITTLSYLLSLREKQLTLLKHTKQALLEQMFVNE